MSDAPNIKSICKNRSKSNNNKSNNNKSNNNKSNHNKSNSKNRHHNMPGNVAFMVSMNSPTVA